jgi:hypothetical protein
MTLDQKLNLLELADLVLNHTDCMHEGWDLGYSPAEFASENGVPISYPFHVTNADKCDALGFWVYAHPECVEHEKDNWAEILQREFGVQLSIKKNTPYYYMFAHDPKYGVREFTRRVIAFVWYDDWLLRHGCYSELTYDVEDLNDMLDCLQARLTSEAKPK